MIELTSIEGVRAYLEKNPIFGEETLSVEEQNGGFTSYTYKVQTASGIFYLKHSAKHLKGAPYIDKVPEITLYEANAYKLLSRRLSEAVLPTLVSIDANHNTLVVSNALENVSTTLKDIIHEQRWPLTAAHEIGYHIGILHGSSLKDSEQVRYFPKYEERFYASKVAWLTSDLTFNSAVTQHLIQEKVRAMTNEPKTLLMGDLAPRNIITDGEQVAFIDLANATRGWPSFDIGYFAGHILLNAIEFDELSKGLAFLDTFREGYVAGLDKNDAATILKPTTIFEQAKVFAAGWMHRRTFQSYSPEDIPPDELLAVDDYINKLIQNEQFSFVKH